MEQRFDEAVAAWRDFYQFTGVTGITLLGLLGVALSLRLDIFRDERLADVRAFALHTFATYFALGLVAVFFLIPHERPAGLGIPLVAIGLVGIGFLGYIARESGRVPAQARSAPGWALIFFAASLVTYLGLVAAAVALLAGRTGALPWLVPINVALLTEATVASWILLSHAHAPGG